MDSKADSTPHPRTEQAANASASAHVPVLSRSTKPSHTPKPHSQPPPLPLPPNLSSKQENTTNAEESPGTPSILRFARRSLTPSAPSRKSTDGGFWQTQLSNILKFTSGNNDKQTDEKKVTTPSENSKSTAADDQDDFVDVANEISPSMKPTSIQERISMALKLQPSSNDGQGTPGIQRSMARSKSESTNGGLRKLRPHKEGNENSPTNEPGKVDIASEPYVPEPKPRERSNSIVPTRRTDDHRFISKRDKIALEIYKTECTYVASLEKLVKIFYRPLKEIASQPKQEIITTKEVMDIFTNLETIYDFNTKFRDSVEERINDWSMEQKIADVFLTMGPFLKMYTQYVNNYDQALSILNRLQQKQSFRSTIQEFEQKPECCGLTLQAFLIMPVQRVPRYVLLLQELQKNTDSLHPDYPKLLAAFKMIKEIADQINEKIREDENARKFFSIQHRLVGFDYLIQPHRRFLGGLKMTVGSRTARNTTDFFLFNDLLVSTTSMNSFIHCDTVFPFHVLWLNDPYPDQLHFEIISPEKKLILYSTSWEEKNQNYSKIYNAVKDLLEKSGRQPDGPREGEFSSLTFGVYNGEWLNAKMHGKGRMVYVNGNFYQGEWKDGRRKGHGRFIISTPENVILEGEWDDDKLNGEGVLSISTGMKYIGQWVNGQRQGKGKILYPDEEILYEGEFKEGNFHGQGALTLKQGPSYTGEFNMSLRHGKGTVKNDEGTYAGEWANDRKEGKGRFEYPNGDVYEGNFKDDVPHGNGTYRFFSGIEYVGQFCNGKLDGSGKISYPNGDQYTGDVKEGRRHGFGRLSRKDKNSYLGQWVCDRREGKGKHTYSNGDHYEGAWKDDQKHGSGVYKWANGGSFTGNWLNDRKEGKGLLQFRLSSTPGELFDWEYDGTFKDDKMHGQGTLRFPDGSRYEGGFCNDMRDGRGTLYPRFGEPVQQTWKDGILTRSTNSIILSELQTLHRFC